MTEAPRRPALAEVRGRVSAFGGWGGGTRLRRYLPVIAVLALSMLVIAGLAVAPVRRYFGQRDQISTAESELEELRAEVADLDARLQELRTDEAVERIARQHYDLVFPGEESYRILPAPEPGAPAVPDRSAAADDGGPAAGGGSGTRDGGAGDDDGGVGAAAGEGR